MRLSSPPTVATGSALRGRDHGLLLPVIAVLALAGGLLRAAAVPPALADVDGVNFARALVDFDPLRQSPHFPGYPVYVALTSVAHALGASEVWALALPSILLWPVAAVVLALGSLRAWGRGAAIGALFAASIAPGAITLGAWPGADGLGFALFALGLGALALASPADPEDPSSRAWFAPTSRVSAVPSSSPAASHPTRAASSVEDRWSVLGGVALGLLLGVRLTWWPLVLGALWIARDRRALVAVVLAVLAWAVPLAVAVGPRELVALGLGFTGGHFEGWGNTLISTEARFVERCARAAWDVLAAGLGGAWLGATPLSSGGRVEGGLGGLVITAAAIVGWLAALLRFSHGLSVGAVRARAATASTRLELRAAATPRSSGPRLELASVCLVGLVYLAWVLVAQNVDKPRHLLPLLPIVGALAGLGWAHVARVGRRAVPAPLAVPAAFVVTAPIAVSAALAWVSVSRAALQRTTLAPQAAVVAEVVRLAPSRLAIFAGEESRVFEHLAPMYRVMRPASAEVLATEAARLSALGIDVLVTSGAPGASSLSLEPLSTHHTLEVLRGPESVVALHRHRPVAPLARGPQEGPRR